jgi:hypothetical protein
MVPQYAVGRQRHDGDLPRRLEVLRDQSNASPEASLFYGVYLYIQAFRQFNFGRAYFRARNCGPTVVTDDCSGCHDHGEDDVAHQAGTSAGMEECMDEPSESVQSYLDGVTPERRRRDAEKLLELMARVTGEPPRLWGRMIGFGQYHYKYKSGREGDAPAASFSPRKAATSIYLSDGIGRYGEQLEQLGPHTTGVGCLYIKDLDKIDISVLAGIITESYRTLTADTYGLRAREGAATPADE